MTRFEPKNPDYDASVHDSFNRQQVMHTLGISIAELSPGRIVLEMAHQDTLTQQHGFLHAGIVSTALDSACGYPQFSGGQGLSGAGPRRLRVAGAAQGFHV
jgi:acyl-coenzyme A thioesterase PaaI-like protein